MSPYVKEANKRKFAARNKCRNGHKPEDLRRRYVLHCAAAMNMCMSVMKLRKAPMQELPFKAILLCLHIYSLVIVPCDQFLFTFKDIIKNF